MAFVECVLCIYTYIHCLFRIKIIFYSTCYIHVHIHKEDPGRQGPPDMCIVRVGVGVQVGGLIFSYVLRYLSFLSPPPIYCPQGRIHFLTTGTSPKPVSLFLGRD